MVTAVERQIVATTVARLEEEKAAGQKTPVADPEGIAEAVVDSAPRPFLTETTASVMARSIVADRVGAMRTSEQGQEEATEAPQGAVPLQGATASTDRRGKDECRYGPDRAGEGGLGVRMPTGEVPQRWPAPSTERQQR